jgi:hypothetical protein
MSDSESAPKTTPRETASVEPIKTEEAPADRGSLQEQVQHTELKQTSKAPEGPVTPAQEAIEAPTSNQPNLLDEIQKGVKLKKTEPKTVPEKQPEQKEETKGFNTSLVDKAREAAANNAKNSNNTDTEDGWDD